MAESTIVDKPLQRVSTKEKLKNNKEGYSEWGSKNLDFFIKRGNFDSDDYRKQVMFDNYNFYNNVIPEEKFHYITNPLGSNKENHQNFPARIRPYNIIRPNVDLYMGEFIKRTFPYTVLNLNTEAYTDYEEKKKEALYQNIYQRYINSLNELGVETGEQSQEVELPEEIEKNFKVKYTDIKALKGQQKLKRIEREKDLFIEYKRLFKDYIIAGECVSYKGVEKGTLDFNRVAPLGFRYGLGPNKTFIEDSDWQVHKMIMTPAEVVDRFYDKLKKKHYEYLDETTSFNTFSREDFYNRMLGAQDRDDTDLVFVYHVCWKSQVKVGEYTYIDELGQLQKVEVPETFKLSEEDKMMGNKVEWFWVNEAWEGYRLGEDFYLEVKPIVGQRNVRNNYSICKLPYNGVRFSDTHSINVSPVSLGIPYQIMFIAVNYFIEKTLAKNKGKIAMIDKNVIPNDEDWDEEKFFYYSDAMGWAVINRDQVGVDKSFNQYQVLDLSQFQHINQLIQIKDSIKEDYDELLGITRQRKGQVQASDSVGGTQAATFQSSLISELLFSNFDDFRRCDYQGIMDLCKFTTMEGERGMMINDDLSQEIYNIEPGEFTNLDLGVYVSNNSKDITALNQYKQFAQAFAQNGQSPSTVLEIIRSDNVHHLESKLKQIEEMQMEQAQQGAKSEQERVAAEKQLEQELEGFKSSLRMQEQEAVDDRLDNREIIKGDIELQKAGITTPDTAEETVGDIENRALEREKLYAEDNRKQAEANVKQEEVNIKKKEVDIKEKGDKLKAETEKYKADMSLKVAKENKGKYDKK